MTEIKLRSARKIKRPVTAIIQARMESKRLPGKSMLPLAGKPLLHHVIQNTIAIEGISKVVLATSKAKENLPLIELAESLGIGIFVGSPDNVLERYYLASEQFGGDFIVRATGDNPFADPEYAAMAVAIAIESKADLCSISNIPLGTAVEVIKREALVEAFKNSDKPYQFEHVTPYIKKNNELFHIERHSVNFENPFENLRLTVDTPEDYELARILYENLYKDEPLHLKEIIEYLIANPDLNKINGLIQQRPMTHSEINF